MKPNHKCDPARMALLYIRQQFICTTFKFDAYCMSLLKLSDKYGKTRLENACQLALDHISQPGYKNIKMILQSNQDLKDKNDNVQSECDMHAFVRGKDYYGGKNNG